MKKILLSLLLLGSIISNAQKIGIGLRAGLNLSNIYYSPAPSYETNHSFSLGFQAALVGEFSFGKIFSIVPELAFSQQGFGSSSDLTDINGNALGLYYTSNIYSYVNIPVLFRLTWKTSKLKFFLNTGPQLGIFTSAIATSAVRTDHYDSKYFNSSNFGWVLGGGMGIKLGQGWIFGDLRGTLGLTNIFSNGSDADVKSFVAGISFGYIYEFGK